MSFSEIEGESGKLTRNPSTFGWPNGKNSSKRSERVISLAVMDAWPSIDVIIPTLNCETNLRQCLQGVRSQLYAGRIEIIVVDGGSTDATLDVARNFGSRIYVNRGQYGTGATGARHYGERVGTSDLVWCIDSDNLILESHCAQFLATPFIEVSGIVFTVPLIETDPIASPFCNWLALDEIMEIGKIIRHSTRVSDYWVADDMTYGLSNACMIRRSVLMAVGGYDSDVRLLQRLRLNRLSKAAIVPRARFYHKQAAGVRDYRRKWLRRMMRFAALTDSDFGAQYKSAPPTTRESRIRRNIEFQRMKRGMIDAPINFARTGDSTWLAGLAYLPTVLSVVASHPFAAKRTIRRFL